MKNRQATPQRLFGASTEPEISFTTDRYLQVWQSLTEAIGESDYFNGKVTTNHEGFTSLLTTTLIVYRDRHAPEHPITHLVPIWWEMTTHDTDEKERLNDFSFKEFLDSRK